MSRIRHGRRGLRAVCAPTAAVLLALSVTTAGAQEPGPDEEPSDDEKPALIEIQESSDEVLASYQETQTRIADVQAEIAEVRAQIPVVEAAVDVVHQRLQKRAAALYKDGSSGGQMAIFNDDPQTAGRRTEFGRAAARADATDVTNLREMQEALEAMRVELEAREAEAVELAADLERQSEMLHEGLLQLTEGLDTAARLCPVQGPVLFRNDWGDPRPDDRTHQGTDIFGMHGSENVAVAAGTITQANEEVGGLSVYLHGDDGHVYYYTHLSGFEGEPRTVEAGEVIGYTGTTGNAVGTPAHTHFEIHENGSVKVNPYLTLRHLCLGDQSPDA